MRLLAALALVSAAILAGCSKPSEKPITSEQEMRKATDEMVKRQMEQMGKPVPGGAPGAPGAPMGGGAPGVAPEVGK